ncbi:MAG TPA: maleylpyruvate isomerase family mycothiol-dependent enzyme [Pseudonocardia sp.]|jgi:uncharacterized protein (TIGR03083 family)|nr:maleylpyruvate isomerase family mycothiol-dependent enzyme [Pseudonocardia sp.]
MDEQIFAMIAEQRRDLADLLDGLTDAQWQTPSLCEGWRVREVVAHLVMPFSLPMWKFTLNLIARRGNFNRVMDERARAERRSNAELVEVLRANAETRFLPPGPKRHARMLADVVVHGQDIARPLGIERTVPAVQAEVVLTLLTHPMIQKFYGAVTDGLSFVSRDGWRWGDGPEVTGPSEALITTLAHRSAALDELGGPGLPLLRKRLSGSVG